MEIEQYGDVWEYDATAKSFLIWKVKPRGSRRVGDHVGIVNKQGYYAVTYNRVPYQIHAVVWKIHHGEIEKGLTIDHIDGNRVNNNIDNLRLVSRAINSRNSTMRPENKSGVKGVFLATTPKRGRW